MGGRGATEDALRSERDRDEEQAYQRGHGPGAGAEKAGELIGDHASLLKVRKRAPALLPGERIHRNAAARRPHTCMKSNLMSPGDLTGRIAAALASRRSARGESVPAGPAASRGARVRPAARRSGCQI